MPPVEIKSFPLSTFYPLIINLVADLSPSAAVALSLTKLSKSSHITMLNWQEVKRVKRDGKSQLVDFKRFKCFSLCGRLIVVGNRYRSMIRLAADFNEIRTQ
jgi:hypothetical protein